MQRIANAVIDLSHWNEKVDFRLAQEDGIVGIIHKATQGTKYIDKTYSGRKVAAENAGIKLWGAYHFGEGANGRAQADHFLHTVRTPNTTLLVLDVEENNQGKTITPKEAEDFVIRVKEVRGRYPVIYGSAYFLEKFATPTLMQCPLWIASYNVTPRLPSSGWKTWMLWQYTDGSVGPEPHTVTGIGPCDRDKFNGSLEELREFWTQSSESMK